MDPQLIYQLLEATMHPDATLRGSVEQQLKTHELSPGFLIALLTILRADSNKPVRQAAAIYFKNRVNQGWEASKKSAIHEHDKEFVRQHLLGALLEVNDIVSIRSQLVTALGYILSEDMQENKWSSFLPTVQTLLSSEDPRSLHTGLLAVLEYMKVYQWSLSQKRAPLNHLIDTIFPALQRIASKLVTLDSLKAGEMIKTIAKLFCGSIRLELAKSLQNSQTLLGWATVFVQIIEKPIPENAEGLSTDPEEREKHPWWKAKKWAYQSLYHLYSRYAWSLKKDKRYTAFSKMFLEYFIPNIVQTYLKQVQLFTTGTWMSNRSKQQLAMFLEECIKPKTTWLMIKPHLESIIVHFIFPILCFKDADQELWDSDPVEFIHKKIDPPIDDFRSPVTGAEELLSAIVRERHKQTFVPTMTFINNILTSYLNSPPNQRNPRQKDGALRMISHLADHLLEDDSPFKAQMEQFIYIHVQPEISSPHGFLRARACDVMLKFGEIEFTNNEQLGTIFQSVVQCLKDPELPVRVSAALAISPFLIHPMIHDAMKPHVQSIMQELLTLTNEIDMDTLTHVMEQLVSDFSEEITPFAVQLGSQLRDSFLRIMGDSNAEVGEDADADEFESKTMAGMGILKTISSLIMAVESSKQTLAELEVAIVPVIIYVLDNSVLDLYDEVFEIIEMSTFCAKAISPTIWQLFDLIYKTFKNDAFDYFENMAATLDNYLTFGGEVVRQSPEIQERYMDIINSVLVGDIEYVGDGDRIRACQLMESMLLNLKGAIDGCVPRFLQLSLGYLSDENKVKNPPFRVHALEVVVNALYYNPIFTLSLLEQQGATLGFLGIWFKNLEHFNRVHDKKLVILTITALLEIPPESLPVSIQGAWMQLFEGILKVFETYPAALEEREKEEKIQNGELEDSDEEAAEEEDESSHPFSNVSDPDGECADENDEYLEYLETKATDHDEDENDDDDDDSDFSLDWTLEEDIYFVTVLDKMDAYNRFEDFMSHVSLRPDISGLLHQSLSHEKKAAVEALIAKSRENRAKSVTAPVAS